MGMPDQFAKRTFAEETERVTGGAITWKDPPEIGLESVQGDGLLVVRRPEQLSHLRAPWCEARKVQEILVEVKMAGDHCDVPAVERTQLRRQALRVQRVEQRGPPWPNAEPVWMVAPHLPKWLRKARKVRQLTPGCYRVEPSWSPFLWIAANDLPLRDDLIPFLVARSGKALDDFARWAATRRPLRWMLDMIEFTTMSSEVAEDLLNGLDKDEDARIQARRRFMLEHWFKNIPEFREEVTAEAVEHGRLIQERAALRRVLAARRIALTPEDEARIEACSSLETLERWHDQAVVATTASEVLRDPPR